MGLHGISTKLLQTHPDGLDGKDRGPRYYYSQLVVLPLVRRGRRSKSPLTKRSLIMSQYEGESIADN